MQDPDPYVEDIINLTRKLSPITTEISNKQEAINEITRKIQTLTQCIQQLNTCLPLNDEMRQQLDSRLETLQKERSDAVKIKEEHLERLKIIQQAGFGLATILQWKEPKISFPNPHPYDNSDTGFSNIDCTNIKTITIPSASRRPVSSNVDMVLAA